jgi:hypothetical protein
MCEQPGPNSCGFCTTTAFLNQNSSTSKPNKVKRDEQFYVSQILLPLNYQIFKNPFSFFLKNLYYLQFFLWLAHKVTLGFGSRLKKFAPST